MKDFLIKISPIITLIGAFIAAIGVFSKTEKIKKIIVFIGVIIVAIGTFLTEVNFDKFETEIKRLNNHILSSITGGDSFCRLSMVSINSTTNNALMSAVHVGKYPLYEVHFRIVDVEEFLKLPEDFTFEDMLKSEINISVGNLPSGNARILRKINLGSGNEKKYNIFISARNGFFTQSLWLKRIEGLWVMATKITKGEKEIYKKVDPSFPINKKGEVNWDVF